MVIQRTPIKPNSLTYLKNFYPNIFPKNWKMLDPGTFKIMSKIRRNMPWRREPRSLVHSRYVDQKFLFQFLLQNIDKIKGATLYVLSSLIFPSYFRHDLDCSRVKHFVIFWKIVWVEIL